MSAVVEADAASPGNADGESLAGDQASRGANVVRVRHPRAKHSRWRAVKRSAPSQSGPPQHVAVDLLQIRLARCAGGSGVLLIRSTSASSASTHLVGDNSANKGGSASAQPEIVARTGPGPNDAQLLSRALQRLGNDLI
jgi:hypothetical protein